MANLKINKNLLIEKLQSKITEAQTIFDEKKLVESKSQASHDAALRQITKDVLKDPTQANITTYFNPMSKETNVTVTFKTTTKLPAVVKAAPVAIKIAALERQIEQLGLVDGDIISISDKSDYFQYL